MHVLHDCVLCPLPVGFLSFLVLSVLNMDLTSIRASGLWRTYSGGGVSMPLLVAGQISKLVSVSMGSIMKWKGGTSCRDDLYLHFPPTDGWIWVGGATVVGLLLLDF